jgi:hypothetical protein
VFLKMTPQCEKLHDLYCSSNIIGGDKVEKNEIGRACIAYGEGERHVQGFGGET